MRCFVSILLLFSIQIVFGADFETFVDPADLITERGYPVETYTVQTEDGYLLALYRIPYGINGTETNPKPVLLNHGLGSSAGDYLTLSPQRSLGYILADRGYDVWLMNGRGTTYSQKHISINESDKQAFYNFSWHQVGFYDIPANIDFILNKTNQTKLQYIGHSQGCTSFLVMGSSRPEYNDKIALAQLLAPAAIMKNVDPLINLVIPFYDFLKQLPDLIGLYNLPFADILRAALQLICKQDKYFDVCSNIYDSIVGYSNHDEIDETVFPNIFRTAVSTFSLQQPLHYLQIIRAQSFQQFDYGSDNNLAVYNSTTPPDYDLGKLTAPVAIYTGENDHCVGAPDAEELSNILTNTVKFKIIEDPLWNHGDFLFAVNVMKYLYQDMIDLMALY